MTREQKHQLREDRKTMSAVDAARKWGITRQRVHQILAEPEDYEGREYEHIMRRPEDLLVRFSAKQHHRLNDRAIQQAILHAPGSDADVAQLFGTSRHAVSRIRSESGQKRGMGRPRGRQPVDLERQRARNSAWRVRNPEKQREYSRRSRAKLVADPEKLKAYRQRKALQNRERYARNPEAARAYHAAYMRRRRADLTKVVDQPDNPRADV